jgi:hypothetical protein
MKIKPEHVAHMRAAIVPILPSIPSEATLRNDPRVKDAAKRRRWDALYAAGLSRWVSDNIYSYADDTHIDTALRAIVPPE